MSREANEWLEKISQLQNAGNNKLLALDDRQDISVSLRPNNAVSLGMFRPDPLIPGGYIAHPVTLRALKKDIFAVGDELFEDLAQPYTCERCASALDRQFWHFCPYCEAHFKAD